MARGASWTCREDEAERARLEELRASYAGLCSLIKDVLGDKVEKVPPCCLVSHQGQAATPITWHCMTALTIQLRSKL